MKLKQCQECGLVRRIEEPEDHTLSLKSSVLCKGQWKEWEETNDPKLKAMTDTVVKDWVAIGILK